jgi:hypothetical protein
MTDMTTAAPAAPSRKFVRPSIWSVLAVVIAAIILLPIVTVVSRVFVPSEGVWAHLMATVLPTYLDQFGPVGGGRGGAGAGHRDHHGLADRRA